MKQSITSLWSTHQLQSIKEGIGTKQPQPVLFVRHQIFTVCMSSPLHID